MEFNKLVATAKDKGIKVGFMTKGLYKMVAQSLPDQEKIQDMGEGLDKKSGNKAPIIITGQNVYFFSFSNALGGLDQATIPIQNISSISVEGGALLPNLVISEGTNSYVAENVGPKAHELMKCINGLKSTPPKEESKIGVSDELREMKALLDDGIITQEEFDKKKKELLGL